MKAVWFNSVGEVFDIIDDTDGLDVFGKMVSHFRVASPGDTIKLVEDEEDQFKIGGTYHKMRTA